MAAEDGGEGAGEGVSDGQEGDRSEVVVGGDPGEDPFGDLVLEGGVPEGAEDPEADPGAERSDGYRPGGGGEAEWASPAKLDTKLCCLLAPP